MKARRYTEEHIIAVLRKREEGARVADLCRTYGTSEASYYNWKASYAGMTASDLRPLRALEAGNRRLKQIVDEQALDDPMLKQLISRSF